MKLIADGLKKEKKIWIAGTVICVLLWLLTVVPLAGEREDILFSTDDVTAHWDERSIFYFPEMELDKGVYLVEIDYLAGRDLEAQVTKSLGEIASVQSTPVILPSGTGKSIFRIMPDSDETSCSLTITEAEASEAFMPAEFPTVRILYSRSLSVGCYSIYAWLAILGAAAVIITLYWCKKTPDREAGMVAFALLSMILIICFSLIADGTPMSDGGDQEFHLERIAHLAEALKHNVFQLRMQPNWHNGYGYPVAMFYGELFLVPSALLYAAGMPLYQSYNVYIVMTGIGIILCSYFSFKMITGSRVLGLLGSVLHVSATGYLSGYVFFAYGGVAGSAAAFPFLPIVAAGFFAVHKDRYRTGIACLVIGFSGLLHTHIITVTRAFLFSVLYFLAEYRTFCKKERFLTLLKSALITMIVNLWFLVPFLDYYTRYDLAGEIFHFPGLHSAYKIALGISPAEICLLVLCGYCLLTMRHSKEEKRQGVVLLVLYLISLLLQTDLFPYKWLYEYMPPVYHVLTSGIQFLQRYGVIASLLVIVFGLYELSVLVKHGEYRGKFVYATAVIGLLAFITMLSEIKTWMLSPTADYLHTLDLAADDFGGGGDNLYLFDDISFDPFIESGRRDTNVYADGVEIGGLSRDYTKWSMEVTNKTDETGYLEFPVFHYYGYEACGDGASFPITDGESHKIRVGVPPGFEGNLTVDFFEPWYWRVAEVVSVIGFFAALFLVKRNVCESEESSGEQD